FLTIPTYADDGSGIDDGGAFDEIPGVESYKCYYFDLEELGILDTFYTAINAIGNLVWNIIKLLTKLVMMIMYVSLSFDAGEMLSPVMSGIQSTIHESIFEPLFVLAFCGTAIILLKRMFVRDLMGAFGDIVKVVVIVVLSIALVKKSDSALSMITGVTKEASVEIMTGINDNTGLGNDSDDASTASTDFALRAAALLWENLVDEPWQYLEFAGTDPTVEDIENFLSIANQPGSDNRASLVANYTGAAVCFEKGRALIRLACILVYFIPFIVKFALYTAVAGIQLIMQVITVVYMLIAPVILLLALLPGYENAISTWLRKMLEAQLGILIITFLLGIIIKVDKELYDLMDSMGGFLVVSIIQMVILVGIYFGRNKIMGMLAAAQDVSKSFNQVKTRMKNDVGAVRERFMTDEQRYLRAYDEKMKKSYAEQGYRDSYYQNIRYSDFNDLEDHQKTLWLDMKQKEEKTRAEIAELDAPARPEEDKYADAYDKGIRNNYYKKKGREKYDRELMNMKYDELEDYQKGYWKQLHNDDKNSAEGTKKAPRLHPEETDRGREDIYAGNGETGGSQGSKRTIIKKRNSEPERELPQQDEYPGEAMDNVANDGNVNQRRLNNDDKNSAEGSNKTPILQQEGTNSGEEDIYDSNEETGGSQGSKRNIIKKRTSEPEKELPQQDEYPDEAMDNVAGDRHVNQKRLYNDDRDDDKIQK
ncbi:MAG: type IV secretion system protein, partial [Lachnospiraceae bacterium]|nr:type IV secretion system protein [Lachnospiraceae bacterium]